jgi:hypothetical protein
MNYKMIGGSRKYMKTLIKLLLAFISIVVAQPALACKVYTYEHASKVADIVFVGTPEKISNLPEVGELKPADVIFNVTKHLKGTVPQIITILDTGNNCYGLPQFETGSFPSSEYLVFAVKKDDHYETFHPMPNTLATKETAQEFIKSLNKSNSPKSQ